MPRIFICYSRVDEHITETLVKLLRNQYGWDNVWNDTRIVGSMDWWQEILRQINNCDVFVYLLSNDSVESEYCRAEFTEAQRLGRPVVTVQVRGRTRIPAELTRIQYVDMSGNGVKDAFAVAELYKAINYAAEEPHSRRANWRPATVCPNVLTPEEEAEQAESSTEETLTLPIARPSSTPAPQSKGITPIQATIWAAVIGGIFALLAAGITILPDMLNRTQSTPTEAVQSEGATQTPTTPIEVPTTAVAQLPTERDMPTTPPPTLSAQEIVDQQETQTATHKPPTVTNTYTPTSTPTDTLTPTNTPSYTPTLTPTRSPLELAATQVAKNNDWEPHSDKIDGAEMVLVPVGCFMMGSNDGDSDEREPHQICFSEPFWIDKYEVTNADYGGSGGCDYYSSADNQPRNCVTWFEAKDYCEQRGARLPTETEWEYAARGPESWVYPWGDEFVADNVVYAGNSSETAPVGSKPQGNSWVGALDMAGNVWEWTSSIYQDYPYDANDGREDIENTNSPRVLRGGSFFVTSNYVRAAFRIRLNPSLTDYFGYGFRCARSIN